MLNVVSKRERVPGGGDPVDAVYGTLNLDMSTDEAVQALRGESDPARDPLIRYLIEEPPAEGAGGSTVQTLDEDI